jgi:hypothetical protein
VNTRQRTPTITRSPRVIGTTIITITTVIIATGGGVGGIVTGIITTGDQRPWVGRLIARSSGQPGLTTDRSRAMCAHQS